MSLPVLETITDGADFALTVRPFLSQLIFLPSTLAEAGANLQNLKDVYLNTNPLVTAFAFALFLVPIFVIASEVNKNYSQVDRAWSILPVAYNAHYTAWAYLNNLPVETLLNILVLTVIWGARLTFNYWRKGGYKIGSEDYRWAIVREKVKNPALFFILNVSFISFFQSMLLALITTPTYVFLVTATVDGGDTFAPHDYIFSRVMAFVIIIETFADHQQWTFQKVKKQYQANARIPDKYKNTYTTDDLNRGFVVSGLWSWCRHPNFAAEQAFWIALYQWACLKTDTLYSWSGVGVTLYILLFQASTIFTERISARKYPEYKEYQKRVGKFIPRWSIEPMDGSKTG
ncbi:hypothetical protein AJ80_05362 [Polytolypa hystricis UAMH7299]|uniref:Steroid 5-alpha reductase C-terminal domain-containing protein n=1 Tax=Polytolypa hystricis (strain UAMH7299) TaxID=1447883 RepID=A0A2B7Y3B4_POLH7|nr:hypothetical protein AJ80_05362 [Polytolypa hystricis UAMH7299]